MDYRYFDDFTVGEALEMGEITVTEPDIIAFAEQFDPQPMHTDPQAAEGITGGLIASGWHSASLTMRLFVTGRPFTLAPGSVGLGVEHLKWHRPVRPGDTLRLHAELIAARPSASRPGHGIITSRLVTRNQRGETVLEMTTSAIVAKRPSTGQQS